jgi:hypothetical protein
MDALFKIEVHLSDEGVTRFGECVAAACVQFPAQTRSDILDLQCLIGMDPIPMDVVRMTLARMLKNTEIVIPVADALAVTIGMCQPVRIDGGPVQ